MNTVSWLLLGLSGAAARMLLALAMGPTSPTVSAADPRTLIDMARNDQMLPRKLETVAGLPVPEGAGDFECDRDALLVRGHASRFARIHGPHPVRPLGTTRQQLREELKVEEPEPCELAASANGRLGTLNLRTANPLAKRLFQCAWFASDGRVNELCLGTATGGVTTSFADCIQAFLRPLGPNAKLSTEQTAQVEQHLEAWFVTEEKTRRRCFEEVVALVKAQPGQLITNAIAGFVEMNAKDNRPRFIIVRDDANVRHAIAAFLAAERTCRRQVEEALR